jgi:hypothetical protein
MSFSVKLVQERCFAGQWVDGIGSLEINLSWQKKGQSIIKLKYRVSYCSQGICATSRRMQMSAQ